MRYAFCKFALATALLALVPAAAQAVPLNNPGFETGTTAGWNASGDVTVAICAAQVVGCAPGGGTYFAGLNNSIGNGNASLTQTVTGVAPGTYNFGAWVSFGTNNPAGNFDQGQISLTLQISGSPGQTVGFDPNTLNGQFTIPASAGFSFTDWFLLQGVLTFAGSPTDLLLNINVQDFSSSGGLVLLVDNAFITDAGPVPLPGAVPLFASGLGVLGLFGWRRKKKARTA